MSFLTRVPKIRALKMRVPFPAAEFARAPRCRPYMDTE